MAKRPKISASIRIVSEYCGTMKGDDMQTRAAIAKLSFQFIQCFVSEIRIIYAVIPGRGRKAENPESICGRPLTCKSWCNACGRDRLRSYVRSQGRSTAPDPGQDGFRDVSSKQ